MSTPRRPSPGLLLGLAIAAGLTLGSTACNSDKVTWSFVSDPGGDGFDNRGGGTIIVIRRNAVRSASIDGDTTRIVGSDRGGALTAHLPHGLDLVVLERPDRVELRSPALPQRRIEFDGATVRRLPDLPAVALEIVLADAAPLVPTRPGPASLFVPSAAHGNLLVLSHRTGVVQFSGSGRMLDHGDGSVLDPRRQSLVLLKNGRQTTLRGTETIGPAGQLRFDSQRDSVTILGPFGRRQAEIPRSGTRLHNGLGGLLLTADFPSGVNNRQRRPLSLIVAAGNRYLLRVSP